jgi:hypothetical protein
MRAWGVWLVGRRPRALRGAALWTNLQSAMGCLPRGTTLLSTQALCQSVRPATLCRSSQQILCRRARPTAVPRPNGPLPAPGALRLANRQRDGMRVSVFAHGTLKDAYALQNSRLLPYPLRHPQRRPASARAAVSISGNACFLSLGVGGRHFYPWQSRPVMDPDSKWPYTWGAGERWQWPHSKSYTVRRFGNVSPLGSAAQHCRISSIATTLIPGDASS